MRGDRRDQRRREREKVKRKVRGTCQFVSAWQKTVSIKAAVVKCLFVFAPWKMNNEVFEAQALSMFLSSHAFSPSLPLSHIHSHTHPFFLFLGSFISPYFAASHSPSLSFFFSLSLYPSLSLSLSTLRAKLSSLGFLAGREHLEPVVCEPCPGNQPCPGRP